MDANHNKLISQELLKLSYSERNSISEEIHGVKCLAVEETPKLITESLKAFQLRLDAVLPSQKEPYNKIVRLRNQEMASISPSFIGPTQWRDTPSPQIPPYTFVDDGNFRLRFLRCELFDIEKAVLRFLNYLDTSFQFFGAAALSREVRIRDLAKSQVRLLRKGHIQVLPYRDRAGRCVVISLGTLGGDIDQMEWIKTFFFIGDSVTRDSVESQQKGIVYVGDVTTKMSRELAYLKPEHYSQINKLIQALPSRMVAIHACWPASFNTIAVDNLMKFFSRSVLATRIRFETGTEVETRFKLRGYGIPIHLLPLTKTGAIKVKYLNEWIKIRKLLEEASAERFAEDDNALSRVVVLPGLTDVIFRQGTPSMKNPGNVTFRDAMINHLEQHYSQPNDGEREPQQPDQVENVCNWLIEMIENTKGGRFLEWDKNINVWVKIVDRQKLKFKVTIAYRDVSKRFLNKRQKITDAQQQDGNPSEEDGSHSFVEGGKDANAFCGTANMDISRNDSNYSESGSWF